jgi:hypothetical protein
MQEAQTTYSNDLQQPLTKADALVLMRKLDRLLNEVEQLKNQNDKAFYTCKEFSDKTGIPESTVRYHCNTGEISARKRGKSWQIPAEELKNASELDPEATSFKARLKSKTKHNNK